MDHCNLGHEYSQSIFRTVTTVVSLLTAFEASHFRTAGLNVSIGTAPIIIISRGARCILPHLPVSIITTTSISGRYPVIATQVITTPCLIMLGLPIRLGATLVVSSRPPNESDGSWGSRRRSTRMSTSFTSTLRVTRAFTTLFLVIVVGLYGTFHSLHLTKKFRDRRVLCRDSSGL